MKHIDLFLPLEEKKYTLYIGINILSKISEICNTKSYSKVFILTDKVVAKSWLSKLQDALGHQSHVIMVDPGEKSKNINTTQSIWMELLRLGADRKSLLINLGGGVIGDMGGFAASTYMRGMDFIQVPTTLLAQVDASVGGKVGIDFADIKNLIGTFHQPEAVIIDPQTLSTLSTHEFLSGFAEIVKHGLIKDKAYFHQVTAQHPTELTIDVLEEIIYRSCVIKSDIITSDEKEGGVRKILNFGHTVGHAIESLSHQTENPLLHGSAISAGMIAEAKISQLHGLLSENEFYEIENALQKIGLPTRIAGIDFDNVLSLMKSDKKNYSGKMQWVLLTSIGSAVFDQEVPDQIIRQGIEYILLPEPL